MVYCSLSDTDEGEDLEAEVQQYARERRSMLCLESTSPPSETAGFAIEI